jgi:DeoR/GlpR family transcriptional regulator of sugar metabolism
MTSESILPAERRQRLLEYIQQNNSGRIETLAVALEVSEATIRRDLALLESEGLISRTYGGAVSLKNATPSEHLFPEKRLFCPEEKLAIGIQAASMVNDGETLILDSGSTTYEIARNLTRHKNLTIITYDLFLVNSITYDPSTTIILTGGTYREDFNVLIGPFAEDCLHQVRVNKAFLGAGAVDITHGVTASNFIGVQLKRLLIEAASQVILVADHTKFGKAELAKVCSLDQIDHIITDSGIEESVLHTFQQIGLETTVADVDLESNILEPDFKEGTRKRRMAAGSKGK